MVREQLFCIVTPLGAVTAATMAGRLADAALRRSLHEALVRHGAIHYATFTLLPPSPEGTPSPSGPALALALAVDAGLTPPEAIERLVALARPALAGIYEGVAAGTDAASLRQCLEDPRHLHGATGGFVGARDRTVRQIQAEASLFEHLRTRVVPEVVQACRPPALPDARSLAAAIADRVRADPEHAWASRPAAQSRGRAMVTPTVRRLAATAGHGVLVAALAVVLAGLALAGTLTELAVAAAGPSFIGLPGQPSVDAVLGQGGPLGAWLRGMALALVLLAVASAAIARWQGAPVLALELVLVVGLVGTVTLALAPFVILLTGDADTLGVELRFALEHVVIGVFVTLALALFVAMLVAAGVAGVCLAPPWSSPLRLAATTLACAVVGLAAFHGVIVLALELGAVLGWSEARALLGSGGRPWTAGLIVDRIAVVVIVVAAAIAALLYGLLRLLSGAWARIVTPLNAPRPPPPGAPYGRLHQTADSLTACEVELAGRTACMVSLTEMRRPYFVHATAARFFLWLVSSLGWHVYSEGRLGNVASIQFAHWHVVDRGRRLLFCANFEGDFGGYLDDFITGEIPLINVIWRWTRLGVRQGLDLGGPSKDAPATASRRFPRTRLALFSGCRSEQQFKAYARDSMLPFQFHFAAYDRPLAAILGATRVRDAIAGERGLVADDALLRALER